MTASQLKFVRLTGVLRAGITEIYNPSAGFRNSRATFRARMQSPFFMLSSIATAIISPAKQSIIGAIYSFPSLHGNERYVGRPFLVRSVRAKVPFQKIFKSLRLFVGFGKPIRASPALVKAVISKTLPDFRDDLRF